MWPALFGPSDFCSCVLLDLVVTAGFACYVPWLGSSDTYSVVVAAEIFFLQFLGVRTNTGGLDEIRSRLRTAECGRQAERMLREFEGDALRLGFRNVRPVMGLVARCYLAPTQPKGYKSEPHPKCAPPSYE